MKHWYLKPLLGAMLSAGVCGASLAASATVYYYKPYKNWATVNMHHNASGTWTTAPGDVMGAACANWVVKSVNFTTTNFSAVFTDGLNHWDNLNNVAGSNYVIAVGTHQVKNGQLLANTGNPCAPDTVAPTIPANLASTNLTATSVDVSWSASSDAVGVVAYDVYRDNVLIGSTNGSTLKFSNTGLAASTRYVYTVLARDAAGNKSALSAQLIVNTPFVVTNTASIFYYTKTRAWPNVNIHYMPTGGTWTAVPGVPMNETACTDWVKKTISLGSATGLTAAFNNNANVWDNNGGRDYVLATGISTVKDGVVVANAASPCVPDTTPPTVPGTLTGSVNGTTVSLSWGASTDASNAVSYIITRSGGAGTATFNATSNSFTDTTAAAKTTYQYSVIAKDPSNNKSASGNILTITTGDIVVASNNFSWDNATVYFLLNDRFVNGDTSNDRSYKRETDANGVSFGNDLKQMPSAFHGGDLKGITSKINSNYFKDLGINAIWITAPYEQIHGFVAGDGSRKHYGYHGYYTLDWSNMDANMGTRADMQELVDAAHAQGIRVVMDIVLNHTGYDTIKDSAEYGYGALKTGWQNTAYKSSDSINYDTDIGPFIDYTSGNWANSFWGSSWIRFNNVNGYDACQGSGDGLKSCVGFLPDIKTELIGGVGLPPILSTKWTREGRLSTETQKLDTWFSQTGKVRTPSNYIIKWLSDYVRDFGIDGFRVDTAKHVELNVWKDLKTEAAKARQEWMANNPTKAAALKGDTAFWMTGEVWNHGVGRDAYFDNGFDSLINFNFQGQAGNVAGLDGAYLELAGVNADNSTPYNMLSYISSHDKGLFDRNNLKTGLTSLLLAPGAVQLFYGDESARPLMSNWAGDHVWRGDMNWGAMDNALLSHAQKLGKFRQAHVAVGAGSHQKLADGPYTFARIKDSDKVVMAIGASGTVQLSVGAVFADGTVLRDAYSGAQATVTGGKVGIAAHANGVILLENTGAVAAKPATTTTLLAPRLKQSSRTAESVGLSWQASCPAGESCVYEVYRNNVLLGASTGTSFMDSGLSAGKSYNYSVTVRDSDDHVSPKSAVLKASTAAKAR